MPGASAAAVQGAVASVLMELGLSHVARSRVGGTSGIRGISGGERRRWVLHGRPAAGTGAVLLGTGCARSAGAAASSNMPLASVLRVCRLTVAMELVIEPAVLVLDEPTSGLDSYTALNLMRTMKQVGCWRGQEGRVWRRDGACGPALLHATHACSHLRPVRVSVRRPPHHLTNVTVPPRSLPSPALALALACLQVASGGRIVLLSFHQPSPAMFSLLDRTFLMAAGHCIFSGGPAAAEPWFAARGLPCPVGRAVGWLPVWGAVERRGVLAGRVRGLLASPAPHVAVLRKHSPL